MKTWIALLRGINVGGKNILPMAELRQGFESMGLKNVRTYIQSGNVVFDSPARSEISLAERISLCIEERHGFRPYCLLLSADNLARAVQANPFPFAVAEPSTLHFFFLTEPASKSGIEVLASLKAPTEEFQLVDRVFYLYAPDGVGRSKLAANVEKRLGGVGTARNYRTIDKLLSMVSGE